jgi:hypothetical protein
MADAINNVMTVPVFSQHLGYGRTYGYQLKKEGRLVLNADGLVLVAESIARIEETKDPARNAVADRHAAARATDAAAERAGGEPDAEEAGAVAGGHDYDYQRAKAKREHYAAAREHTLYLREAGQLMERGQVLAAFAHAGALLRARLEGMPATVAPTLIGRDEAAMHAVLVDQVEQVLRDISRAFEQAVSAEGGEG